MALSPRTTIATLLFTDLVDSTALMQRVGDESAQRLFRAHHELLQEAVAATGGTGLQWMGDGLMVAFASAGDAVRCAIAMQQAAQRAIGGQRLAIRVGLNSGEALHQDIGSGYFGTRHCFCSSLWRAFRSIDSSRRYRTERPRGKQCR